MAPRIGELRALARAEASRRGVDPRDVDVLLGDAAGRGVAYVIGHDDAPVSDAVADRFRADFGRRLAGEPLQYIRGRTEFFGREFTVDPRVLIPRPETELLVEAALECAPRSGTVVDVGTGTGCIAITLAAERSDLFVLAVDRSIGALAVARRNAARHASPVRFVASDVLASFRARFDLIASNPPYIPAADLDSLAREVRDHEPRVALTPGAAGTEMIERLLASAAWQLRPGGRLLMEIGFGQEAAVNTLVRAHGWEIDRMIPDLAGIARVVVLSRP